MRLIDADEFQKQIAGMAILNNYPPNKANALCELIDRMPTAFDAENIIKQLEEERDYSYEDYENYAEKHNMDVECDDLFCRGLDRAIEIVKRGGRDER